LELLLECCRNHSQYFNPNYVLKNFQPTNSPGLKIGFFTTVTHPSSELCRKIGEREPFLFNDLKSLKNSFTNFK